MIGLRTDLLLNDSDKNGIEDDQEFGEADQEVDLDDNGEYDMNESDDDTVKCLKHEMKTKDNATKTVKTLVRSSHPIKKMVASSGEEQLAADKDNAPEELPVGLYNFEIEVDNPGDKASVELYFSEAIDTQDWVKYTSEGWKDYPYAQFEEVKNGTGTKVTLQLTDGDPDRGDDDEVANGIIHDPSGAGAMPASTTSGGGSSGGGCLMQPDAGFGYGWLLLLIVPTLLIARTRKQEHRE